MFLLFLLSLFFFSAVFYIHLIMADNKKEQDYLKSVQLTKTIFDHLRRIQCTGCDELRRSTMLEF